MNKERRALLKTMEENKEKFSKRQRKRAEVARKLCETVGFGSLQDFQTVIQMNGIKNNPVASDDIKIMKEICGDCDAFVLKGKTTRSKPKVVQNNCIDVPHAS